MTRALVTQLVDALEVGWSPRFTGKDARALSDAAITAAREYLATEPSGERAELIARLAKQWAELDPVDPYRADIGKAADMLEADAQQGAGLPLDLLRRLSNTLVNLGYATPEGGMEHFSARIEWQLYNLCRGVDSLLDASRQHAKRVPPEESEDLYTLALKADNWGQP